VEPHPPIALHHVCLRCSRARCTPCAEGYHSPHFLWRSCRIHAKGRGGGVCFVSWTEGWPVSMHSTTGDVGVRTQNLAMRFCPCSAPCLPCRQATQLPGHQQMVQQARDHSRDKHSPAHDHFRAGKSRSLVAHFWHCITLLVVCFTSLPHSRKDGFISHGSAWVLLARLHPLGLC
jgi:hypothetical protein